MLAQCSKCGFLWDHIGTAKFYTICPKCNSKVSVKPAKGKFEMLLKEIQYLMLLKEIQYLIVPNENEPRCGDGYRKVIIKIKALSDSVRPNFHIECKVLGPSPDLYYPKIIPIRNGIPLREAWRTDKSVTFVPLFTRDLKAGEIVPLYKIEDFYLTQHPLVKEDIIDLIRSGNYLPLAQPLDGIFNVATVPTYKLKLGVKFPTGLPLEKVYPDMTLYGEFEKSLAFDETCKSYRFFRPKENHFVLEVIRPEVGMSAWIKWMPPSNEVFHKWYENWKHKQKLRL